jgi:hypothetical protein
MHRLWLQRLTRTLMIEKKRSHIVRPRTCLLLETLEDRTLPTGVFNPSWDTFAQNPQHTAISEVASQPLQSILWQTPVDLDPQYSGNELFIHYGSPLVTSANTVIVPVKTGAYGGFDVEGIDGSTGTVIWTNTTDYILPPGDYTYFDEVPSYSPTLAPGNRLYFAGAGGTIYYIDKVNSLGATVSGQLAFFGLSNYQADPAAYNGSVYIDTPITSDSSGNIYFGFTVSGSNPLGLRSGIARIDPNGNGTWIAASAAANDSSISRVVENCAPALSNDGQMLYIAVSNFDSEGYLVALNSTTLQQLDRVLLIDPNTGEPAALPNNGTASPMIGPDGDVYFGVLENPFSSNNDRGWLLHFSSDLSQTKTPGAFGWDDTASVVPAWMVPSYHGSSTYLVMTKYNNYAGLGGDGENKLAVLDPNATMTDPITGATVMQGALTILGPTPDPEDGPDAVKEWCINSAVVDPFTDSILVNSEDGNLYRWDLATNTLTQQVRLTAGLGEAYTPTLIGVDGTVYAINNATLFAVGAAHFQVAALSFVAAGSSFTFTVTAENSTNNTATGYSGTVNFCSSDGQALLPANSMLTSGVGVFSATLVTAGSQTLVATDTVSSSVAGSVAVTVTPQAATHFLVSSPGTDRAGQPIVFTVLAEDSFNNTAQGYSGTVAFSASDSQAVLPDSSPLTDGIGVFAAVLETAGAQTIIASDSVLSSVTGASNAITVNPAAAAKFNITAELPVYPGITSGPKSFATTRLLTNFSVTAVDSFGNPVPTYSGTLEFMSSDSAASLPASATITGGAGTLSATLMTVGSQTLTVLDTVNDIEGTSSPILTRGLVVTSFAATPSGFTIAFNKAFNPDTVVMYTTGTTPDDIILATTGTQISVRGSVLVNAADTSFTFIKTDSISSAGTFNPANGLLAAGNYTLTLRSLTAAGNGFQDALGIGLDGANTGGAANYKITFSVSAPPVAVGIPDFARGPSNTDALLLPSTLTNGSTFALSYTNPVANPPTGTAIVTFSTTAATLTSNIQAALTSGGLSN